MTKAKPKTGPSSPATGPATSGDVAGVFNPWPYVEVGVLTHEDQQALSEMQLLLIQWAADLDQHRPSSGFEVLRAVSHCASNGVPVPTWLAQQMHARLAAIEKFTVSSLDDPVAFGPAPSRVGQERLEKAARRARWGDVLRVMYTPDGQWPRTQDGFALGAKLTGMTKKQVAELLPKTRKNAPRRGPHDPFGLLKLRRKKPNL